jgi:hypothetical protein
MVEESVVMMEGSMEEEWAEVGLMLGSQEAG